MEKTFVCLSSYYKGYDFMDECKKLGNKVILITSENIKEKNWPWHAIDDVYFMHETEPSVWNMEHLIQGFSYLMKIHKIDAVVALDDFDVEKAAMIRETFRIAGMGQTTHRYFRDKLAMRQMAKDHQIDVPEFTAVFNDNSVKEFIAKNPSPWVLKPRSEASATGIIKIYSEEDLWEKLHHLGEERFKFLLEVFEPGNVYHVDSLIHNKKIIFSSCSQYLSPPMEVSHDGGVFRTRTIDRNSQDCEELLKMNENILSSFGIVNGATHTEFIKSKETGKYYFLETSSRVGGAHIPDLIEEATGINIWREWARLENALLLDNEFEIAEQKKDYAGLIISLANTQTPDLTEFDCPELVKKLEIPHHVGLVYKSDSPEKIEELLNNATQKIVEKYLHILPPKDKPTA